jgi:hypothetical protein
MLNAIEPSLYWAKDFFFRQIFDEFLQLIDEETANDVGSIVPGLVWPQHIFKLRTIRIHGERDEDIGLADFAAYRHTIGIFFLIELPGAPVMLIGHINHANTTLLSFK